MTVTPLKYKRIDAIKSNLAQCTTLNQDVIHDLRVEIKALRAIYPVLEQQAECKNFNQEPFSTLMQVFKKSGKLRLVQVNVDLASEYSLLKDDVVCLKLEKRRQKAEVDLLNFLQTLNYKELEKNLHLLTNRISNFVERGDVSRVQLQMDRNLKRIMSLKARTMSVRSIHRIRSLIKRILALASFAGDFEIKLQDVPDLIVLKQFAQDIGSWHDAVEFEYFLEKFLRKHPSEALLNIYADKRKRNLTRMQQLYKALDPIFGGA